MKHMKIVYEDNKQNKVVKGQILKEDEFTYTLQTHTNVVVIGKRYIVSAIEVLQ